MKTFFNVTKYILANNPLIKTPIYFINAICYQVFKRLTGKTISKRLFNKREIFLFPHCNVSTALVYTDIPDKKEILFLRDLARKDDIFLDIGSNIGQYSVMLMDLVKGVYAFEPHPVTANRCKMNFLLNGVSERNVLELAISDKSGEAYFTDGPSYSTNKISTLSDGSIKIKVDTLDNIARNNFSAQDSYLVKIDTEGFEKNVLQGGEFFFKNYPVKGVVFECSDGEKEEVFGIFRIYGYEVEELNASNYYARNKRVYSKVR